MSSLSEQWLFLAHFSAGGVAGMAARTVIAPVERIKIIYQVQSRIQGRQSGWTSLCGRVLQEGGGGLNGLKAFWKGNLVAVMRVFPYLGVQLSANEQFRRLFAPLGPGKAGILNIEGVRFCAGSGAGVTAVFCTYPLDLARARLALLMEQGAGKIPSMFGVMREVYIRDGVRGLWSGAGISMTGAGLYCGLKFASYDACKDICRRTLLPDPEGKPSVAHRAISGGLAGVAAQTVVYPVDVIRRRLQTGGADAKIKYPNFPKALWRVYADEGLTAGLYRGLSLNYLKTLPNTMVYLTLFDYFRDFVDSGGLQPPGSLSA